MRAHELRSERLQKLRERHAERQVKGEEMRKRLRSLEERKRLAGEQKAQIYQEKQERIEQTKQQKAPLFTRALVHAASYIYLLYTFV